MSGEAVVVDFAKGHIVSRYRTDLIDIESQFSSAELEVRDTVAEFVDRRIRPNVARWYEEAILPRTLFPEMAELGLFGMHLQGYGCAGKTGTEYGLAMQELEAGDSGLRTVVSVQGSLAMSAIAKNGSPGQKQRWLPKMARGEVIGCFGLTEPTAGSDPAGMQTTARRDGDGWVLNGSKRWIGLASIADIAIIWARAEDEEDPDGGAGRVRGFIVPTDSAGFSATLITAKLSMRVSNQCDISLNDVRLPAEAILPKNAGLRGPFACLSEARYGIAWGAMGAARDAIETALSYAAQRRQFGRPLSGYQLTQQKLADMGVELVKGQLLALHLGRAKDAGVLQNHMISVGKLNNCRAALDICREARTILGGNGITGDYSPLRHANNLESVRTYEGTDEVHTLILGQQLTGESAFR